MCENLGHRFQSRLCNVLAGGLRQVPYPACLPGFVELGGQVWEEPLVQRLEHQMGAWLRFLNLARIPTCSIDHRALYMLGQCPTTDLHPRPLTFIYNKPLHTGCKHPLLDSSEYL